MSSPSPLLDPRLLRLRDLLDPVRSLELPPSGPPVPHGESPSSLEPGGDGDGGGGDSRAPARAAVAVVLRETAELELLLIQRAISQRDPWSGHMALPGGRFSPGDRSLVSTAIRETAEETGLILDPGERLLGSLDPLSPSTRRLPPLVIAPFVFGVEETVTVVPDPREVQAALWVPLSHLQDPATRQVVEIPLPEGPIPFPAFQLGQRGEHVVWGLTYRILDRFLRRISR